LRGSWGDETWTGWWGDDPPFHTPVFVLTHPREPVLRHSRECVTFDTKRANFGYSGEMLQTYHVDVTLSGTGRHIVGPASSQSKASTDLDRIRLAQDNDDSVVGVPWLAVGGRNIQAARVKRKADTPAR
jgi:hypothetical protein